MRNIRPIVFFQRRPTQVDAPFYRLLTTRGISVHSVFRESAPAIDPEMDRVPDFGDIDTGYAWTLGRYRVPENAHVAIEGWHHTWAWRELLRLGRPSTTTVGVRFDSTGWNLAPGLTSQLSRARAKAALRIADYWHPTGTTSLRFAESIARRRPSVPIPYFVPDGFMASEQTREARSAHPAVALVVAKLNKREGVSDVVEAFADLPGWRLLVAGDGPDRADLEERAKAIGIDAEFLGYVPYTSLPSLYQRADVFVHPAYDEPWGVSVQEAMLASLPIIATSRVGAARDLLTVPVDDWCYDPGDVARLRRLLASMSSDALRHQHSVANRKASQANSVEAHADSIIAFLEATSSPRKRT